MPEPNGKDKAEDKEKKIKKPREYKRFERLLKQVIKAAPLRTQKENHDT